MFFLYRITLPDGRAYIGVSKNPCKRFGEHCRNSSRRCYIDQTIREVGKENVIFQVLVGGARSFIYELEKKAIAKFRTRWPFGFNVSLGGVGGRDPLPITRAKISAASKAPERVAKLILRNQSPEFIERINYAPDNLLRLRNAARSLSNAARLVRLNKTPEHRAAQSMTARSPRNLMRLATLGRAPDNVARLIARNKSPEMRERVTAANKARARV